MTIEHARPEDGTTARPVWHEYRELAGYSEEELSGILTAPKFDDDGLGTKRRFYRCEWLAADFDGYSRWTAGLIGEDTSQPARDAPYEIHYDRLSRLGIGPSYNTIKEAVGSMQAHHAKLGLTTVRSNQIYADWEIADFARYARDITAANGRRLSQKDVIAANRQARGPSYKVLVNKCGSLGELNELLGFPDVKRWDEPDYVDWGARVREANDGRQVTRYVIGIISGRDRGPSVQAIVDKFDTLYGFQSQVEGQYEHNRRSADDRQDRLAEVYETIAPDVTFRGETPLSRTEEARVAARYLVAKACIPPETNVRPEPVAALPTSLMVQKLLRRVTGLSRADIELAAFESGYYDELWPDDAWRRELHVDEAAIAARRSRSRPRTDATCR